MGSSTETTAATDTTSKASTAATPNTITEAYRGCADQEGARSKAAVSDSEKPIQDLRVNILRNALYHGAAEGWLGGLHRWNMFVVVAAGTGAVTQIAASHNMTSAFLAALAALAGAADLVFAPGDKARAHGYLRRRYYELMSEIETEEWSEQLARSINGRLCILYSEEPPQKRALDAISYNAAKESLEGNGERLLEIRWYHSLFRHVLPFNGVEFGWKKGASSGDGS